MLAIDFREAFNSAEGVLSASGGGIIGSAKLEFVDKNLLDSFEAYGKDMNINFCNLDFVLADGADMRSIDWKSAGKRLGARMKEVAANFAKGDDSELLPEEIKLKAQFPAGLLAHNKTIRITIDNTNAEEIAEYNLVLELRRKLKVYITETLGLNIVPNIWRSVDEPAEKTYILSIVLCECSETLYQACEKWARLVFKNTLFNFRVATRKELLDEIKGKHEVSDTEVKIICKIHGEIY